VKRLLLLVLLAGCAHRDTRLDSPLWRACERFCWPFDAGIAVETAIEVECTCAKGKPEAT
jgi:hypothetical protein